MASRIMTPATARHTLRKSIWVLLRPPWSGALHLHTEGKIGRTAAATDAVYQYGGYHGIRQYQSKHSQRLS